MLSARILPQASKGVVLKRYLGTMGTHCNVIAAPPKVRVSFMEKTIHGLLFSLGIMAFPVYACFDIGAQYEKKYQERFEWYVRGQKEFPRKDAIGMRRPDKS